MKIETKFDVGQEVWFIENEGKPRVCEACNGNIFPSLINYVCAGKYSIRDYKATKSCVKYLLEHIGQTQGWDKEQDIFRTKKEAIAECRERNETKGGE